MTSSTTRATAPDAVADGFGAAVVGFGASVVGFGAVVEGAGAAVEGFGDAVLGFGAAVVAEAGVVAFFFGFCEGLAPCCLRASLEGLAEAPGSRTPPATVARVLAAPAAVPAGAVPAVLADRRHRGGAVLPLPAVRPVGAGHGDRGYADDADGDRGDDRPPVLLLLAMDSHT
ncbi:hypothetical protein ACFQV4_12205 [Streptomyces thermocarboxydus]